MQTCDFTCVVPIAAAIQVTNQNIYLKSEHASMLLPVFLSTLAAGCPPWKAGPEAQLVVTSHEGPLYLVGDVWCALYPEGLVVQK